MLYLQMLSWPAGPKPYDGVWAPWWYAQTHRSTGDSLAAVWLLTVCRSFWREGVCSRPAFNASWLRAAEWLGKP